MEAPIWNGNAFFGGLMESNSKHDYYSVNMSGGSGTGFNFIHVFCQWQFFIYELTTRMKTLAKFYASLKVIKTASVFEYLGEALSKKFSAQHLVNNFEAIEKWLFDLIVPSISNGSYGKLKDLIHDFCNYKFQSEAPKDSLKLKIQRTHDIAFSYGANESLFVFKDFQTDISLRMKEKAQFLNSEMKTIGDMTDVDKVLFKISELRNTLRQS